MEAKDFLQVQQMTWDASPFTETNEQVVEDEVGGDIYIAALVNYISETDESDTELKIKDKYHAVVVVGTTPLASTKTENPIRIGTFRGKDLYMSVSCGAISSDGRHNIVVNLLSPKE